MSTSTKPSHLALDLQWNPPRLAKCPRFPRASDLRRSSTAVDGSDAGALEKGSRVEKRPPIEPRDVNRTLSFHPSETLRCGPVY